MHNFKSLEIPFSKASYKSSGRGSLPASSVWVGGTGGLGCESCWCDGDPRDHRQWCQAGLGGSPGAVGWALHVPVGAVSPHPAHIPAIGRLSSFAFDALFIWLAIVASILNMLKRAHFSVV